MSPRGGKRDGAGRPKPRKKPLVGLTLKVDTELRDAFWRMAGKLSGPQFLAILLHWTPPARRNGQRGGRPAK